MTIPVLCMHAQCCLLAGWKSRKLKLGKLILKAYCDFLWNLASPKITNHTVYNLSITKNGILWGAVHYSLGYYDKRTLLTFSFGLLQQASLLCLLQQGCLERLYLTEGPCSRTCHQLVNSVLICSSGSLWSATPTKVLSACACVHA